MKGNFFQALGITNKSLLKEFAKKSKISTQKLEYYNEHNIFPSYSDFQKIQNVFPISDFELKLKMGILDNNIIECLQTNSEDIINIIRDKISNKKTKKNKNFIKKFQTEYGVLYQGDCISLMEDMEKESIDLIFADPPFNLDKKYESNINDNITESDYLKWTEEWVLKCVDLLKEGGSIFIWNLPKWNTYISSILNKYLEFKHWITVDIKYSFPIKNRLYPSHYSLLYYTKGKKAKTFNEQRIPLEICRHCGGDIKDYGGYKNKLNPKGINLSDVWLDIQPVRHSKYKTRGSNELPLKLLERIISLASNENDIVFDPFGGSGTTYIVSEILKRKWIGIEIGPVDTMIKRFNELDWQKEYIEKIQSQKNKLFTDDMIKIRKKNRHWLLED